MAYSPVQLLSTPLTDYPAWWLKFYNEGTTTLLSMATDSTGGTLIAKAEISSGGTVPIGFIKTAGNALLNPYINGDYDAWLFPTAAEADANDTTNAIQLADNLNADPNNFLVGQFEAWSGTVPAAGYSIDDIVYATDTNYYISLVNSNLNFEPSISPTKWQYLPTITAAGTDLANIFTKTQKFAKGADVASATALTLGTDGNYFDVTGTTTITSIATVGIGTVIKLQFDAALILTHHATDLIMPGGANITTAAGDEAEFVEYATGDWRCIRYQLAALVPGSANSATTATTATKHGVLNVSVIDIGDWNMDTTVTVNVAHGIADYTKIRAIHVAIRTDTANVTTMLPTYPVAGTSNEFVQADTTNINISRATSGAFDGAGYSTTTYNRGWITIYYID